jgi:hypothetical protein
MKTQFILTASLFTILTAAQPVLAATEDAASVKANVSDETAPTRLSDLDLHLNPQLGLSNFEYSNKIGGGKQKFTGGLTTEFGGNARKFETGLMIMQTGATTTLNNGQDGVINVTYLTLPMMAKLRVLEMKSQSWYAKFGGLTALTVGSSDRSATNGADVMLSGGLGGRFVFTQKSDFLIEATYNKGLLEAVHTSRGTSYNQGFVVLAGLSFRI